MSKANAGSRLKGTNESADCVFWCSHTEQNASYFEYCARTAERFEEWERVRNVKEKQKCVTSRVEVVA